MVSSIAIYCLHTVKWFQILLSNANSSIYTQLNSFKYDKWLNSSIWWLDGTLTGTTTLGKSRSGRNDSKGVLHIHQSSRIEVSPSDGSMPYLGYSLPTGGFYSPTKIQLAYPTADLAKKYLRLTYQPIYPLNMIGIVMKYSCHFCYMFLIIMFWFIRVCVCVCIYIYIYIYI